MELRVKNGYVLVEQQDGTNFNLMGDFICAKIAVAAPQDVGTIIFCDKYVAFDNRYLLVKIEDVAVWIAQEAPVVADESAAV